MTTEFLNIPYDEESLSIEEQQELENYCAELHYMLMQKIKDMGLCVVSGFCDCITKFTQEELDNMPVCKQNPDGSYSVVEEKKYPHLKTLDCFDKLKEVFSDCPNALDDLEEEMRWYEEEATDEDIGECGENLSSFLCCVYGDADIIEWVNNLK